MIEIEFKPEEIISKITELQKVQIPRASEIALNQAVYAASQELKSQAKTIFNKTMLKASLTFQNPLNKTYDTQLIRRAKDFGSLEVSYTIRKILLGGQLFITSSTPDIPVFESNYRDLDRTIHHDQTPSKTESTDSHCQMGLPTGQGRRLLVAYGMVRLKSNLPQRRYLPPSTRETASVLRLR